MTKNNFMQKAVDLANKSSTSSNKESYGAVIVKNNEVIATGVNEVDKKNDPTAHAEIQAIRNACEKLNTYDLSGCEIYASTYPSAMCLGAVYHSNIKDVYYNKPPGPEQDYVYRELDIDPSDRSVQMTQLN